MRLLQVPWAAEGENMPTCRVKNLLGILSPQFIFSVHTAARATYSGHNIFLLRSCFLVDRCSFPFSHARLHSRVSKRAFDSYLCCSIKFRSMWCTFELWHITCYASTCLLLSASVFFWGAPLSFFSTAACKHEL